MTLLRVLATLGVRNGLSQFVTVTPNLPPSRHWPALLPRCVRLTPWRFARVVHSPPTNPIKLHNVAHAKPRGRRASPWRYMCSVVQRVSGAAPGTTLWASHSQPPSGPAAPCSAFPLARPAHSCGFAVWVTPRGETGGVARPQRAIGEVPPSAVGAGVVARVGVSLVSHILGRGASLLPLGRGLPRSRRSRSGPRDSGRCLLRLPDLPRSPVSRPREEGASPLHPDAYAAGGLGGT